MTHWMKVIGLVVAVPLLLPPTWVDAADDGSKPQATAADTVPAVSAADMADRVKKDEARIKAKQDAVDLASTHLAKTNPTDPKSALTKMKKMNGEKEKRIKRNPTWRRDAPTDDRRKPTGSA